jgi:hypothetical protein
MPINIVLQTIQGNVLGQLLDPYNDLAQVWPVGKESFPLLQYIDPYGNTIFNQKQMPQVLKEDAGHEYLRFVGD